MELDMTKGNPFSLILKFLLPVFIGNVFQQLYNSVDAIIVGRCVGNQGLAAVGATSTIMFLIIGFMQGMTAGVAVLPSQKYGAGDWKAMRTAVVSGTVITVIVTIFVTILSATQMRRLLHLMNTPEDIFEQAYSYIIIISVGMATNVLYNLLASYLRAVGNSKVPLYFLIISALSNVFLDLLFVAGFHMGVAGAAWATILAQGLSGVLCLVYIWKKVPLLVPKRDEWKFEWGYGKSQLAVGLPMALQYSITAIGTIMIQSVLNQFGSLVVAAYTAASKLEQLFTQFFPAMGVTMATYAAQNTGKGDVDRIRRGVGRANVITLAYAIVAAAALNLLMPYGIRFFISENLQETLPYVRTYIMICSLFFFPLGEIFVFRHTLQGCGFGFIPMLGGVVELVSRAVMAMIAGSLMSYEGVCGGNASAWLMAAIFFAAAYFILIVPKAKNQTSQQKNE